MLRFIGAYCLLNLLFAPFAKGQDSGLLFQHLTINNGLSQATNPYIYRDSKGFVWLSSLYGLNRFDGQSIKVYKADPADSTTLLSENIQSSFFEDKETNLWFTTYESVNVYNRASDNFQHFNIKDTSNQAVLGYYAFYLDSDLQLWLLAGDAYIYTFSLINHQFQYRYSVTKGSQRAVAVANQAGKVACILSWLIDGQSLETTVIKKNNTFETRPQPAVLRDKPLKINHVFVENEANIWLSTDKGLGLFDWQTGQLFLYAPPQKAKSISSCTAFNETSLLVSVNGEGVWLFDTSKKIFTTQAANQNNTPLSITNNNGKFLVKDSKNSFWLSTAGLGVDFTYPQKRKFALHNPLAASKQTLDANGFLEVAEGIYWASTYSKGVFVLDKNLKILENHTFNAQNPYTIPSNSVVKFYKDHQNRIWVCTWKGMAVWLPERKRFVRVSDDKQVFIRITQMHNGQILACSVTGGVYEIKPISEGRFQIECVTAIPTNKAYVFIAQDAQGRLWLNEELQNMLVLDPLSNFRILARLKITGETNGTIETDSTIWVCSVTGLYKVNKYQPTDFQRFSEKSGLANEGLYALVDDKKGRLWMSHNRGISSFDMATSSFRNFTVEDGLPPIEFNDHAVWAHSDGTLWFGSMAGITVFNPQKMVDVGIKAVPNLINILVNDKTPLRKLVCLKTGATNITEIQSLEFGYAQNTLSFDIVAAEYSAPRYNRLKYKLVGLDADWVETSARALVRYPNLSQGTYRFMVIAANSDGIWNDTPRVLHITIHPPFWKTWWFIALCLFAALSLVGYIVYLRLSKVIELQKIRLKLYENLHDDIGSRLTAIVLSVDNILEQTKAKSPALQQIGDISKQIVGNMRRLVWATAPENDALINVVQQMQAERRTLLPLDMAVVIEMNAALKPLVIGGDKRYQMLSIFNESLTNTHKYAEATTVKVLIEREMDDLILTISDNGKGFDPHKPRADKANSSGYGLPNMQRRAQRIGGKLTIQSAIGKGTTIVLTFPIYDASFKQRLLLFFKKTH
jgi:ligand-binding sensor domain-containing protein/anti-sigma regulatory factor (Ser/Thr protein kinase)